MSTVLSKEDAHQLVEQLPAGATWEDLMREIYVRAAIEKGLEDSRFGRTKDVAEIRRKYGLPE
jgi:Tfp pilus assembly protein PilO